MQWPPTSPGSKARKFHLVRAASSTSHDRDADLREDLGHFVDERDVDVALRILDRLGRLGRLDRGGPEHAPAGHRAIEPGELLDHLLILAGDDLGDLVDTVLAVTRVDPLGTVAEPEVVAPLEAR